MCFPARISFKSAIIQWTCVNGFSSVGGGGVKRWDVKLEDGVICESFVIEALSEDVSVGCSASRSCTMAVAQRGHG